MKCPNCNVNLVMSERQGVEIDYCPECRGVWLDRGELDKIIEKSAAASSAPPRRESEGYYKEQYKEGQHYKYKKKRPGSFLDDIFDF